MQVIVQSKTLSITEALRQFVDRQAGKLARLGVKVDTVRIFLETVAKKKHDSQAAQVTYAVALPGKKEVVVKRHAADMYAAIVDATTSLLRQVKEVKQRRLAEHRQRARA